MQFLTTKARLLCCKMVTIQWNVYVTYKIFCPCCGYGVFLCGWQESEVKTQEGATGFCDMCETPLRIIEIDGKITAIEDI